MLLILRLDLDPKHSKIALPVSLRFVKEYEVIRESLLDVLLPDLMMFHVWSISNISYKHIRTQQALGNEAQTTMYTIHYSNMYLYSSSWLRPLAGSSH